MQWPLGKNIRGSSYSTLLLISYFWSPGVDIPDLGLLSSVFVRSRNPGIMISNSSSRIRRYLWPWNYNTTPVDTWRNNNVLIASKRRRFDVIIKLLSCFVLGWNQDRMANICWRHLQMPVFSPAHFRRVGEWPRSHSMVMAVDAIL